MANLKGKTFQKQICDARIRLEARGVSRHSDPESAKSHSHAIVKKRDMYLHDLSKYLEQLGLSGKLNEHMGNKEIMTGFLSSRICDLSRKSATNYISGISSMLYGLVQRNITIHPNGQKAIDTVRDMIRKMPKEDFRTGRAVEDPQRILKCLYTIRFESGVIAQIQYETGFRVHEAYKLARSPDKYIQGEQIVEMVGKGNHMYEPKPITRDLIIKINAIEKLPTHHTYLSHLKIAAGDPMAIAHDWRITYVRERYDQNMASGMKHAEALLQISSEVNHHRPEITTYYLARA